MPSMPWVIFTYSLIVACVIVVVASVITIIWVMTHDID